MQYYSDFVLRTPHLDAHAVETPSCSNANGLICELHTICLTDKQQNFQQYFIHKQMTDSLQHNSYSGAETFRKRYLYLVLSDHRSILTECSASFSWYCSVYLIESECFTAKRLFELREWTEES